MPNPHGVQLVDEVVASVSAEPGRLVLDYAPWVGATLTFPSGRPLPPRADVPGLRRLPCRHRQPHQEEGDTYTALSKDRTYGPRMRTHAGNIFGGEFGATFPDPPFNSAV